MKSLQLQFQSPIITLQRRTKPRYPTKASLFLVSSTQEPTTRRVLQCRPRLSTTARASIAHYFILSATSPDKAGDLTVLFKTGGLLLFVYGIANFLVPSFISKDYTMDEDTAVDDASSSDDEQE
ncbi:hypothetical protein K2173_010709 [Erythroxylum novogranatense]|uniref:PSII 6.1 kDa protein n=1 Tax=Erythroxylum novogranatense TaxID=1862640 RepID=A0AAV8SQX8_9ROSI|nr:hypothetical protein K2173_010709 [Erythroxylum novogranatense]